MFAANTNAHWAWPKGRAASIARLWKPTLKVSFPALMRKSCCCASVGQRSQQVAMSLEAHGYRNLASVVGGTEAWDTAGLPMQRPDIDADFSERYSRHLRPAGGGLEGQQRLQASRMLLVGAGGLGAPAAFYLAAAGVGTRAHRG